MPKKKFSKKSSTYKNESAAKPKNQAESVVIFGLSLLMLCIVLIPGENIWLASHNFILSLFGRCSLLWPILLGYIAIAGAFGRTSKGKMSVKIWLSAAAIMLFCSLYFVFSYKTAQYQNDVWSQIIVQYKNGKFNKNSGLFGAILGAPLIWAFGLIGAKIVNCLFVFTLIMFLTSATLPEFFGLFLRPFKAAKRKIETMQKDIYKKDLGESQKILMGQERNSGLDLIKKDLQNKNPDEQNKLTLNNNLSTKEADEIAKVTAEFMAKITAESKKRESKKGKDKIEIPEGLEKQKAEGDKSYQFPPIKLLNDSVQPRDDDVTSELQYNGQMLVDTLKSFNVQTKIVAISRGPAVTRYELQPASGVKISKITTLADDIALNLAASGVRIEAPIPGKAAVGVEIPNKVVSIVSMKELVESSVFEETKSKLTVVLGRDISGHVRVADLGKMPHLLIAGSTGSGKSVCINSFIISLLYKASPDEVKLLMIDPKVVELGVYNGIPHLLVPVVTDPRKAAGALSWAVNEMLNRYKQFAENNVRDLSSYNSMVEQNPKIVDKEGEPLKKMAQIVIVIDELSDLMMAAPNEVEDYICRLAQMARAAGMHLVIATQRPSVDVITGIIKANIPSRIALAVSSQIDSRTILDMSGAEKLLGHGDMLFSPIGSSKPIRVQGCYVTDKEIEKIINHIKSSQTGEYDQNVAQEIEKNAILEKSKNTESGERESLDPVMQEAIEYVISAGQASTSMLQRRLRIGYARAGRLIDEMEQMGIVGPHEGSKPRQVLMTQSQFLEMNI